MGKMNETIFTMNQEIIKLITDRTDFVSLDAPSHYTSMRRAIKYINFSEDHGFAAHWFSESPIYEKINENGQSVYILKGAGDDGDKNNIGELIAVVEYWTLQIGFMGNDRAKYINKVYSIKIIYADNPLKKRYSFVSQQFLDFVKQREELLEKFRYPTD